MIMNSKLPLSNDIKFNGHLFLNSFCLFFYLCSPLLLNAQENTKDKEAFDYAKLFQISIDGDAWCAFWNSRSGLESLGANLKYNIKPSLVYDFNAQIKTPFNVLKFSRSSSTMVEKTMKSSSSDIRNIAKYERYYASINQKLFSTKSLKFDLMYATFNGNLFVENNEIFNINEDTRFNMNSKWFKSDIIFTVNNPLGAGGAGYRYTMFNKPQAFIKFYGKPSTNNSSFDEVEATKLISANIEEAKIVCQYFLFYLSTETLDNDFSSPGFGDLIFGLGKADVKGETISITNKISAFVECTLGKNFCLKAKKYFLINLKIGYKLMYHKTAVAKKLGKDNYGNIYYGTISSEFWHGPFIIGNVILDFSKRH